eukprot:s1169_g3.t1
MAQSANDRALPFPAPPGLEAEAPALSSTHQAVCQAVLQDVEAKVNEKMEEVWQKGRQMLTQVQEKQQEKTDQLVAELRQLQERQEALQTEHESLKQMLVLAASQLALLGAGVGDAKAMRGLSPTTAGTDSVHSITPQRSDLNTAGTEASYSPLPQIPACPFASAAGAPLSLAEALSSSQSASSPAPLSLATSLSVNEAASGYGSSVQQVFSITLRKADDTELGLNVRPVEKALLVEGILPDGAVEAFNRPCWDFGGGAKQVPQQGNANSAWGTRSPERASGRRQAQIIGKASSASRVVCVGDRITSVNSVSNDPEKMLEESKSKQLLKLTLARGEGPLPEVQAKTSGPQLPRGLLLSEGPQGARSGLRAAATEFVPKTSSQAAETSSEDFPRRKRRFRRYHHYGYRPCKSAERPSLAEGPVPCTYSKTYAYPATVVQEDSGGVAQMESRCDNAGEDYVNNQCEATCIINSNSQGYDYNKWDAVKACPYPAGATEFPIVTNQEQCMQLYDNFTALGEAVDITWNGEVYKTGIGHGALIGVRGNCLTIRYNGKNAVIFQVDIRSWSLEITQATYLYLTDNENPGGFCWIPEVEIVNCLDIPGMPSSLT